MLHKLLAVVLAFGLVAGEAEAQQTSFLLINGTAYPISQLQVSESDFNFWGANILRPPPIKAGERRQINFEAATTYCQADFLINFADGGSPAIWRNLNLCTLSKIKLVYDRMSGITTASYDD
jgi:hypothetical protein